MESKEVILTFEKILNWAGERNKLSVDYGVTEKLCMSEIHVIEIIGYHPGILQTNLCEKMGVTKGRISVIVSKLVKKNMVIRNSKNDNKKELPLELTKDGKIAFEHHKLQDKIVFDRMEQIIAQYSKEEVEHFNDAMNKILEALQQSINE